MTVENKELEDVKKVIRSLLISTKHGLTISELCSEYEMIISSPLPFKKLGFGTPTDFIRSIPDVVRLIYQGGAMLLRGVADETTQHIKNLVCGQKSTKRRNTKLSVVKVIRKKTVQSVLKMKIKSLIDCYPNGVELKRFEGAFSDRYRRRINPQLQGFTSVTGLLQACDDILQINSKGGVTTLYPIRVDKRFPSKKPPPMMEKFMTNNNVMNDTGKMKKKIDEETKQKIHDVLIKRKNGMFSARFPFEYKAHWKTEFELQPLGFSSVVELMSELSDLVDITRPTEKGDFLLIPKNLDKKCVAENTIVQQKIIDYTTVSIGNINDTVELCVSYIVDPSTFWVQVVATFDQLYELMDEMTNFYNANSNKYKLPESSIIPGQPCGALYEDEQWYRGVIRDVLPNNILNIYYVDYGNESEVELASVCGLKEEFMKLPCQAFKAKLSAASPYDGEKWKKNVIEKFYELTCDQYLNAKIIEKEPVISLSIEDAEGVDIATTIKTFQKPAIPTSFTDQMSYLVPHNNLTMTGGKISNPASPKKQEQNPIKQVPFNVKTDLIKCLTITDSFSLHIICYEEKPYLSSMEISSLFWDVDVLRQMLFQKNVEIESRFLLLRENEEIFQALDAFHLAGCPDGKIGKSIISIYELRFLPKILSLFEPKFSHAHGIISCELQIWNDKKEDYWLSANQNYPGNDLNDRTRIEMALRVQALMFKRKRLCQSLLLEQYSSTPLPTPNI